MSDNETTVTARCLCRTHVFTTKVNNTSLPLEASCCHCNSCRHQTGSLYFVDAEWPNPAEDLSSLKKYSFSKNVDIFFCRTCSTPMFCQGLKPGDVPYVITGSLENAPNLVKYTNHIFVGDTLDGGASMWLRKHLDGTVAKRWVRRSKDDGQPGEEIPYDWPPPSVFPEAEVLASPERTPLRCHCGGVNLVLRSATDLASLPESELPFFVNPKTFKYFASTDACDSCRLSFGTDLAHWTFALLSHIEFPSGIEPFPASVSALKDAVTATESRNELLGTLGVYASSPDVGRYFCTRCSAAVFYAVDDRPDLVDVGIGLLDHPSGARAEGLLDWDFGRIGWDTEVKGGWREQLLEDAKTEGEQWRIQRGYPKNWRRVMKEQKEEEEKQAQK
ncbi:DUF636 domain-containing protein [Thozetella sp. PMI_491]|nr:DUF636 domain-containing protein [Thozetella sp. PMI_491]